MEMAETLFNQVFRYFGIPEDIVSDRGPQLISRVWKAFFSLLDVTVSLSSGYHPQTNGQTERKIQEIGPFLRTFCHGHQNSWNQYLGWAEYAQNSLRQQSTGLTPFQCVLGYQPLPLVRRTIWGTIGRLLVPREREGLGRSSPRKELCAVGRWQQIWDVLQLPRIIQVKRFGCRPVTSDCAHPAKSSVPDSLAPSPSWSRSTQSSTGSSYLHTTEYTRKRENIQWAPVVWTKMSRWCQRRIGRLVKSLRNVSNTLLNLCHKELRHFWRQKWVQPGTSKVYLIKWPVSVCVYMCMRARVCVCVDYFFFFC